MDFDFEGGKGLLAADAFGHKFNFNIHHKFTSYKTILGLLLTGLLVFALVPFAFYRL